ncbi:hypothetical protein [uncultured Secundilactobacillus sp.]|uniref:hypothetical protein n=1 Tax=uncultured Secundilactobacillus sp. TaxID=2813935 RepID=UPI002589D516|nr:hypothetical protein [uncultured Secundilactobacillus sp.]
MKRLLISSLMAAGALLAGHLVEKRQTPWAFAQEKAAEIKLKKVQYDRFNQASQAVRQNAERLQTTLKDAAPTITAINQDVEKFQFKLQHRLAQIESIAQHMETTLNKIEQKE